MSSDVRERILATALDLLRSAGIKKLVQPQVAKAMGIPQGHLTYYFPRKLDLLTAVAERFGEVMRRDLLVVDEGRRGGDPQRRALALAARLVKDRERTRALLGLLTEADAEPTLGASLVSSAAAARTLVERLVGPDADELDVELALAALWGLGVQHLAFRSRSERDTDRLIARLGEWLQRPKPAPARAKAARSPSRV